MCVEQFRLVLAEKRNVKLSPKITKSKILELTFTIISIKVCVEKFIKIWENREEIS